MWRVPAHNGEKYERKILVAGVVTLELMASGTVGAQQAADATTAPYLPATALSAGDALDRVTVTATKGERTLRDVPISVTSAATLKKAKVVDLIDLQSFVPSLMVTQFNAVGQTSFIIRGFGNGGGNDGIESSVGVWQKPLAGSDQHCEREATLHL